MKVLRAAVIPALSFLLCFTFLFAGCSGKTVEPVVGSWSAENIIVKDGLVFDKMTITIDESTIDESVSEPDATNIIYVKERLYEVQTEIVGEGVQKEIVGYGVMYYGKLMRIAFDVDSKPIYLRLKFKQKAKSIYIDGSVSSKGEGTDIILR